MEGSYQSTVGPHRRGGGVMAVVELQEVVLAVARVVDADLGEGDRHHAAIRGPDTPLAVGAIGICAGVVGTGDRAMVSVQRAPTT